MRATILSKLLKVNKDLYWDKNLEQRLGRYHDLSISLVAVVEGRLIATRTWNSTKL